MSTRAQIMVKGSPILIYKHSDGYPDTEHGVLHFLQPFVTAFAKNRGVDPVYFLAQLLRKTAADEEIQKRSDEFYKEKPQHWPSNSMTGWGLDCTIHGDTEYLYVVDLKTAQVTVHTERFDGTYLANK